MTTRELPREEWHRLKDTDLGSVLERFPNGSIVPIVVEDEAGLIVGCWAIAVILHAEGIWIAPEHRQKGAVARRLLGAMRKAIRARDSEAVLTGAATPEIANLLKKLGAVSVPYGAYYWPISRELAQCP